MSNGKDGWRLGTSFLRPPVFIHLTDDETRNYGYGYYPGSPKVVANESIIVAVTDDVDDTYHPNNEMGTRDASTLNFIRSVPSPITSWNVSICGRVGSEIIVTSTGVKCVLDAVKIWNNGVTMSIEATQFPQLEVKLI